MHHGRTQEHCNKNIESKCFTGQNWCKLIPMSKELLGQEKSKEDLKEQHVAYILDNGKQFRLSNKEFIFVWLIMA